MTFNYNVTGAKRKELVNAISEITEAPSNYRGAPTFAYEVDYFTIDKNGGVTFDDSADSEEIEMLVERLLEKGFEPEPRLEEEQPTEQTGDALILSFPRDDASDAAIENLRLLVASKATLIKKALGAQALPVEATDTTISLPWFTDIPQPDEITAYALFASRLIDMAKTQKRVTAKEKETDNQKYAFRCFLLRLGFIGDDYKAARKILLRNLEGSGAFKSGNPKVRELVERISADADLYDDVMSLRDEEAADNE